MGEGGSGKEETSEAVEEKNHQFLSFYIYH